MYFETSFGSSGTTAQLQSPAVSIAARSSACLTLWYHMYGEHVSTLNVYAGNNLLWTRSGDQGNKWIQARITVNGQINNKKVKYKACLNPYQA